MNHNKNALVLFAKWPELGKTKTRIGNDTSHEFALEFTQACLNDIVSNLNGSDFYTMMVAVDTKEDLERFKTGYDLDGIVAQWASSDPKPAQSEKLCNIFEQVMKDYEKAILIPMDVPFLSSEDIISAFSRLNDKKFVLGPESNGGVYLVGMHAPHQNIFDDVQWSTMHTSKNIIANCGSDSVYRLKERADFNTVQDLLNARSLIETSCRNLNALIQKYGYNQPLIGRYVNYDDLPINIAVASAIVERQGLYEKEVLMQIRYKPNFDPLNTGKLEVPGGLIDKKEPAYLAAIREVKEETGLIVKIKDEFRMVEDILGDDVRGVSYRPFSCTQQLLEGRAYLGINFICELNNGNVPRETMFETRAPRWVPISQLNGLLVNHPDRIFSFNIPLLRQYVAEQEG